MYDICLCVCAQYIKVVSSNVILLLSTNVIVATPLPKVYCMRVSDGTEAVCNGNGHNFRDIMCEKC